MKKFGWKWIDSNAKRATKIMWETQGRDLDEVCALIAADCDIDMKAARALYRRMAREEMIEQGFVPAPAKLGRPRKEGGPAVRQPTGRPRGRPRKDTLVDRISNETWNHDASKDNVNVTDYASMEPEPEPERTATGEKKSIADMKAYLEQLKKKAGA
jgi:hypothetical protein